MNTSTFPRPASIADGFHVMAKPIGPICNLDCTYCYTPRHHKSGISNA
ncbi:MAG: hypothetical protein M0Q93_08270 [Terrimicrobiaceae bacterium]|nr:hypothetical protein [Terrimicrobiaceae bacterium]